MLDVRGSKSMRQTLLRELFSIISEQRGKFFWAIASLVLSGGISFAFPLISGFVVQAVATHEYNTARIVALILGASTMAAVSAWYWAERCEARLLHGFCHAMRMKLEAKIGVADLEWLLQRPQSDLTTTFTMDVDAISDAFQNAIFPALYSAINLGVAAITMLALCAPLAFVAGCCTALLAPLHRLLSKRSDALRDQMVGARGALVESTAAHISPGGILRSRAFAFSRRHTADVRRGSSSALLANVAGRDHYAFDMLATLGAASVVTAVVTVLGIGFVQSGQISIGTLVTFIAYQHVVQVSVGTLGKLRFHSSAVRASLERIAGVLAAPVTKGGSKTPAGTIVALENVCFAYANGTVAVRNASTHIRFGEKVAIVGESGSGKSTLALLMQGLYRPKGGTLLVDGMPASEYDPSMLRALFSYDSEALNGFHGSVFENIAYGMREPSLQGVHAAASAAQADAFVRELPNAYDTVIDLSGQELSTGQMRRLGVARALACGARFIVLDEPTSALDQHTHEAVLGALLDVPQSIIAITHRLDLTRRFDRIIVMAGGTIAEQGSPSELLARGGLYSSMLQCVGLAEASNHEFIA